MANIRELFHSLGNMHNLITVGVGVTNASLKDCLAEEKQIPKSLHKKLSEIMQNLERAIENTKEADKQLREIHDRIYKIMDPDTDRPR